MTPMHAAVRYATLDDLEAILALDRRSPVGHTRAALLTTRTEAGEILIALVHERVAGYLVLHARSFFGRDFVELLVVDPHYRRQGIGEGLLLRAVRDSSTHRLFTSTNESNRAMLALLEKSGWAWSGRLDGIDDGDPEIVYFSDQ